MDKQKVISSKKVFSTKLFDVQELGMDFSSGVKIFHQVDMNTTVTILPVTNKNEVYVIDQYRPMFGKRVLGAIAGYVDKGETPLQAAKRELKEEVGIEATQWELLTRVENSRSVVRAQSYIYLAKNLEIGKPEPEEGEDILLVKMSLTDAVEKIFTGEIYHTASVAVILVSVR